MLAGETAIETVAGSTPRKLDRLATKAPRLNVSTVPCATNANLILVCRLAPGASGGGARICSGDGDGVGSPEPDSGGGSGGEGASNMSGDGDGNGSPEPGGGKGGGSGACGVCALVKPTIRARTRTPAIGGAAKRPTKPRRAEGRHKREMALTARGRSGGGAPGIEARAEAESAATARTAPNSATLSTTGITIVRKR